MSLKTGDALRMENGLRIFESLRLTECRGVGDKTNLNNWLLSQGRRKEGLESSEGPPPWLRDLASVLDVLGPPIVGPSTTSHKGLFCKSSISSLREISSDCTSGEKNLFFSDGPF